MNGSNKVNQVNERYNLVYFITIFLAIADRIEIGKSFWFGGSSYAKYNFVNSFPIRKTFELSIRLRIRTTEPDGLILWIGRL